MRRSLPIAVALTLLLALGAAPFSAAKAPKHKVTIKGDYISGYRFAPKKITIKKGQSVTWSWSSDDHHNVTFKTPNKHSMTKQTMSAFKIKFNNTGTFKYMCTVHLFHGKVVVTN
jgi:plastocyanin